MTKHNVIKITLHNFFMTPFIGLLAILVTCSSTAFILNQKNVDAFSVIGWNAGRIIDDSIFTNNNSMSVSQIQEFLNSKVSNCDTSGSQPAIDFGRSDLTHAQYAALKGWSAPPYVCLMNYSENGQSSAQIIYNISQQYHINPQVFIVLLQKEQGLVTDSWPLAIQYQTATGYGCPDTAPCDSQYFGLTNQLTWSGRMYRSIMDVSSTWFTPYLLGNNYIQFNPNSSCGGTTVNIENRATQALYNYTPYQPNQAALSAGYGTGDSCSSHGNRNFYLYFNDWFGSTITGNYPSPMYRSEDTGEIYAIINNTKYYIPSPDILFDYGFNKLPVTNVSDDFLTAIPTGTELTNIGRKQYDDSGAIYLFDGGKEYHIQSPEQCTNWGLDCFNSNIVKVLPNELLDRYIDGNYPLTDTINNNGVMYLIQNGKKRPLVGTLTVFQYGRNALSLCDTNVEQPIGQAIMDDRFIVKFGNEPTIYMHDRGLLHPIEYLSDLSDWGLYNLSGANVSSVFNEDPLPRADPLRPIAKSYNGQLYMVSNGMKYPLSTKEADFNLQPYTSFTYPDSQLDRLPSANLTDVLRSRDVGEIFTVTDNKKRVFATIDDIKNLGFDTQQITNIPQRLADNLGYSGLNLPQGRLYKVNGTIEIRMRYKDGYLYVGSMGYANLDYSKTLNVDTETGDLYGYLGEYHS